MHSTGRRITSFLPLRTDQRGYSLIELMIAVAVLTIVVGTVMSGVFRLTQVNDSVSNRSEMHSGVRNATEFMQQEIGQAGRVSFPNHNANKVLATPVATPGAATVTVTPDTAGMFDGEKIVVGTGSTEEVVTITTVNSSTQITATFQNPHAASQPISVQGGFGHGVLPAGLGAAGSTGSLLKIFGDVRGDGQMQYVEYWCDTAGHNLYRRAVDYNATTKPSWDLSHVLLNNIRANPGSTACFTYQVRPVTGTDYVTNVAITLTVDTQDRDPITGVFQQETKALLNVAPRNVFNMWLLDSMDVSVKLQPTPATVTTLAGL